MSAARREAFMVVAMLHETVTVASAWGEQDIPLSFAPGMIGALPVFDTLEAAEAFADGQCAIHCVVRKSAI